MMNSKIVPIQKLILTCAHTHVYDVIVHMRFSTRAVRVSTLLIASVHTIVDGILMSHRYSFYVHDLSSHLTIFILDIS